MKDKYDDLLNKLVILGKKTLLYSQGHELLDRDAGDLIKEIKALHKTTPKIRIAALGNNLAINDVDYGDNNPKAAYLAQLLSDRGIFSISLSPGIEAESIQDFLNLLNSIPKKSKLLYHLDIQLDMYNIQSIEIEEMDYSSIMYGYEDEIIVDSSDHKLDKNQIHKALKSLYPKLGSVKKDQLILMAMEEIKGMSPVEVSDFILGLSDDVVSAILKMLKAKENPTSPSLADLLAVLDSEKKITGDEPGDQMSRDQINKLIEREVFEIYVSDDYGQHLQNQSALDMESLDKFDKIDLFDKVIVSKTLVKALIHLSKNDLNIDLFDSFAETTHSIVDELIEMGDWQFIHSLLNDELVSSYLKKDTAVQGLSKTTRKKNIYKDNHLLEVLKTSGPRNVNWLIDSYIDQDDEEVRRDILDLVSLFGEIASIKTIEKIVSDQIQDISLVMPIIQNNFEIIPRSLIVKLLSLNSVNAKLLGINILLTQKDDKVKDLIEEIIQNNEGDFILELLDLIKEYKITESIQVLISRIKTFYISEDHLKYILKTIDTASSIDNKAYQDLSKNLKKKWFSLSPKKLNLIKKHLIGVSYE